MRELAAKDVAKWGRAKQAQVNPLTLLLVIKASGACP